MAARRAPAADAEFAAAGHDLFDGPFTWPVMVAKRSAIEANIATMAAYCASHGVEFAPHGKTTMAPTLFAAQLDAGAWGITVATANQALAARRFGVPRVLLANELLDPKALRWAAAEVGRGWEFLFYVDSLEGVSAAGEAVGGGGPMRVLVEMGYPDGRTGCRTVEAGVRRGAGGRGGGRARARRGRRLRRSAARPRQREPVPRRHRRRRWRRGRSLPVPLDRVGRRQCVLRHRGRTTRPGRQKRRAGACCCAAAATSPTTTASTPSTTPFLRQPAEGGLTPALEVWAQVLSTPEPGLAILGAGRRDVPFDAGMPVPLRVRGRRRSHASARRRRHRRPQRPARLPAGARVAPGELVCLGISHPCTAFDRWRVIPVVDDDYRVTDLLRTYF